MKAEAIEAERIAAEFARGAKEHRKKEIAIMKSLFGDTIRDAAKIGETTVEVRCGAVNDDLHDVIDAALVGLHEFYPVIKRKAVKFTNWAEKICVECSIDRVWYED